METIETYIDNENWNEALGFLRTQNSLNDIDFWYVFSLRTRYLVNNEFSQVKLVDEFINYCKELGFIPYNIPQAVSLGDLELLSKFLDEGHDVDETEFRDATGLMIAVLNRDIKMVEFLLSKEASNYSEDIDGNKPIDYAIEGSEIFRILKSSGVLSRKETEEIMDDYYSAVDFSNDFRETQIEFMEGAAKGDIEQMEKALNRPKGIWVLNGIWPINGKTALHLSTENNQIATTKFLLDKGLDKNKADLNGNTPLDIARERNLLEILELMNTKIE